MGNQNLFWNKLMPHNGHILTEISFVANKKKHVYVQESVPDWHKIESNDYLSFGNTREKWYILPNKFCQILFSRTIDFVGNYKLDMKC